MGWRRFGHSLKEPAPGLVIMRRRRAAWVILLVLTVALAGCPDDGGDSGYAIAPEDGNGPLEDASLEGTVMPSEEVCQAQSATTSIGEASLASLPA